MDELEEWEARAKRGDFSQIPKPFSWRQSGAFAHLIDGYEQAGGFDQLSRLALKKADEARTTGRWQGTARELWLCLFFEHRAARHTGTNPVNGDALCEALRTALQGLSNQQAKRLANRFRSN